MHAEKALRRWQIHQGNETLAVYIHSKIIDQHAECQERGAWYQGVESKCISFFPYRIFDASMQ
jgi:hypothetical protein